MMKHMYLKVMAALFAVALLVGCDAEKGYLSALPGQSVLVAKVHVGNLLNESAILDDPQISGFLKNSINEMSGDSRTLMREILEDPAATGFDLSQPVYCALENVEQMRGVVILPIADATKVKRALETLLADRNVRMDYVLAAQNGINTLEDKRGNALAAFDAEKLVFAYANGTADALEYMTLSEKAQEKSAELKNFIAEDADMALYVDYGQIMPLAAGLSRELGAVDLSLLQEMKFIATLDFEKGKAAVTYKVDGCEALEKCYKEMYNTADNDLVNLLPSDTWAVAQLGIKNLACVKDYFKGDVAAEMDKMFEEINTKLAAEGIQTKVNFDLLNSIQGDVIIGATPVVEQDDERAPQVVFVAECANKDLFDLAAAIVIQENERAEKIDDNLYSLGMNKKIDWSNYRYDGNYTYIRKGYDYYFGFADNKMFVMPENLYQQCNNLKGFASDFSDNDVIYPVVKSSNAAALDFSALAKEIERDQKPASLEIGNVLRMFDITYAKMENVNSCEFVITMADKDTEMLKQLKDLCVKLTIKEFAN